MNKKLLSITTGALFGLGVFSAASANAATLVNTNALNVRQAPTTQAPIVGKVTNEQPLQVKQHENGWLEINFKGTKAYVNEKYTKTINYVNVPALNVRSGAGEDNPIIGQLTNGQAVTVKSVTKNGWAQIDYSGSTAYVSSLFLSTDAPKTNETEEQSASQPQEQPAPKQNTNEQPTPAAQEQPASKPVTQDQPASQQAVQEQPAQPAVKAAHQFQVVATAYCASEPGNSGLTAAGYDINKNPGMKLIAVDPKVIPLGTKVWVDGYGEAIAGDTGGNIKGNRIDVLMPSQGQADQWGRKTVTVRVMQ